MKKNLLIYAFLILLSCLSSEIFAQGTWTQVTTAAPHPNVGGFMVLSDGTVLCKTSSGGSPTGDGNLWDRLTPDIHGNYINGTWSTIAAMARTRVFFSSQMLKDGRVYVAGGEYGTDGTQNGQHGEVYNPVTNTWTQCGLPNHIISDGNSEILPDGRVLQSTVDVPFPTTTLIYDPTANTYSTTGSSLGGQNESAWLKLPDNSILFVNEGAQTSERYIPSTGQWIADANVPVSLYQANTLETGPCFLLPNGNAIFFGCPHTAIYTPSGSTSNGSWAAGPDIPSGFVMDDAPGAMMPNGNILIAVDVAVETAPTRFYEYNYSTNSFTQVGAPGGGTTLAGISTFQTTMVVLPTGQVLFGVGQDASSNIYYIYTPSGSPVASGKPTISNINQSNCNTFTITGTLFNGISEGAGYGDDFQMASNYPIIRLTSGTNVYYARTFNWNSTGVQRGTAADTVQFTVPSGVPAGTYSLVVTANGISSDTTTFTFNPLTIAAGNNSPICAGTTLNLTSNGGVSYSWTGPNSFSSTQQNPSISNVTTSANGTYTVTVTSSGGCTASATTTTTIVQPTITISNNSPLCAGGTLHLSSTGGTTYSWSGPNTFTSTAQNPTISSVTTAATGTYTVTVTNASGCTASATTSVTVNTNPTATASNNTPVCANSTVNLSSSGGGTYSWSGPNTFTSTSQNPTIPNSTTSATGTYTVTVSNASGCTARATTTVTVNARPTPTASSNSPVCANSNLNLSSTGGTTYSWNGPNGFSSTAQNPIISNASISATGTYTVIATNTFSCTGTATTAAVVNANPSATASNNTPVCAGITVNLSSSGGTSYSWRGPNSFISTSQNPAISSSTTAATGTYTVTVTNASNCSASATTSVTVNARPTPTAGSNSPQCAGSTINLTSSGGGTSYSWSGPNSFSSTGQNASITNASTAATGTYTITVTNAAGCTATASTSVTVNANPTAIAGSNSPVCSGSAINLSGSGGTTYAWAGPNSFSSTIQNPSINNSSSANSGTYSLTVTDNNGCTGSASTSVTVINCSGDTLNLTAFLQGFYVSAGTMRTTLFTLGLSSDNTATDSITINLWLPTHLSNTFPDYSVKTILHKNGIATSTFSSAVTGNSYYIAVKHRNTIETWSHNPVTFSATTSYNFSSAITQAYSNGINTPMQNMGDGTYALFSGDANQDGTIDASDMAIVDNDAQHFAFGYNRSDCNGDGATDVTDLALIDNIAQLAVFYARP